LAEQIPVIQTLHIHQEMINRGEVCQADNERDQEIQDCLAHLSPLNSEFPKKSSGSAMAAQHGH
jgi:hypothetical protein